MRPNNYTSIFSLLVALLLSGSTFAQMSQVTFAVDMNGVAEFDPASDVLRVAGSFQGWNPTDATNANVLTDPDGNGVYAVTMPATGTIQFKYVINNWDGNPDGFNEFSGPTPGTPGDCTNADNNREVTITEDVTLPVYVYNSCDESSLVISSVINPRELDGLTITPNPFHAIATVQLPEIAGEAVLVRVMSTLGQVVLERSDLRSSTFELDGSGLAAGYYLLDITSTTGARAVRRICVR